MQPLGEMVLTLRLDRPLLPAADLFISLIRSSMFSLRVCSSIRLSLAICSCCCSITLCCCYPQFHT